MLDWPERVRAIGASGIGSKSIDQEANMIIDQCEICGLAECGCEYDARDNPASDDTEKKHRNLIPFKPGQSGNPKGRTKGARNKLGEAFIEDLLEDWQLHGASAIAAVRGTKPDQYLRVIASILPRELNVRTNELDELTDEQVRQQLVSVLRQMAADGTTLIEGVGDQQGLDGPATHQ
jgi:hypothetical protein